MVTCVERPLLSHWPPRAWPLVPCVLAVALAVASLPSPPPAPHVHVSPGLLDVALPLARPALHVADEVLLVATRQAVVRRRGNGLNGGWPAVIVDEVVHSEILVGRQALNASAWRDWPKTGESPLGAFHFEPWTPRDAGDLWEQCPTEHWFPANRSLLRRWTGPSQPQIFHLNGLKIAFSSQPRSKELGGCLMGSPMQNYLSSLDGTTPATRVDFGVFNEAERSWIPFVHNGVVRFVYSLLPHVIISAQGQRLHSTSFPPLHRLRHELPDLEIHGAGTAVPMDGADDGQPYYLALLYIAGGGKVTNHFYRFRAQAPFEVLQVSSPLPLMPRSMVTGLARHHDSLLVSYGTGNEGRALVMTLEKMNDLFHCSSLPRS